ncbi:unnamed protein product [Prorocentrum cordatum]|uniref:Peptidase A1 domain-containing protein n=1 Tax=Prorocentrum cordatum TaxID=2364126 RepID=A0ABN9XUG0_9DINO|nr:unnamed protein product [Polarella glacialis]
MPTSCQWPTARERSSDIGDIRLDRVAFGGMEFPGAIAIVDSGTSLIGAPVTALAAISAKIVLFEKWGVQVAKCSDVEDLTLDFVLSGQAYKLGGEDFILAQQDDLCFLALQPLDQPHGWILGDVFMRRYFVEFDWDKERVGIACTVLDSLCPGGSDDSGGWIVYLALFAVCFVGLQACALACWWATGPARGRLAAGDSTRAGRTRDVPELQLAHI